MPNESSDAKAAFEEAQRLASRNENERALVAYRRALACDPTFWKASFGAGLMLQRLGRHDEATAVFSEVISLRPGIAEAHYSRCLSRREMGQVVEALADIDEALGLRPDYLDARYLRGAVLKQLNRWEEARAEFAWVLDREPTNPAALHGRATVASWRGEHQAAIDDLDACIAHGLDDYGVRFLRGLAQLQLERYPEAIVDLTRAIELDPEEPSAYMRRWQAYVRIGEREKAAADMHVWNRLTGARQSTDSG